MIHDIKKMLRLEEPNLTTTGVFNEKYKEKNTLVIHGILTYEPTHCPNCGCAQKKEEGKLSIVKNGTKVVNVRLDAYNHMPTILRLAKQRFHCRECDSHWTAQTYFVEKNCFIAKHLYWKVLELLSMKISCTDIASLCQISLSTVLRYLQTLRGQLPVKERLYLPKVLMIDEFRSHAALEDKMSFICADGETGKLVDVLPSRKIEKLVRFFEACPNRHEVQFLVMDMNGAYATLIEKVFPQAEIIIDRFHVIKHINKAFNDLRVREMKSLRKKGKEKEANKLKNNWKLLLKNQENINDQFFKHWRSFPTPHFPMLTESLVIQRLLDFSPTLKKAYDCFHELNDAFRKKDHETFFRLLHALNGQGKIEEMERFIDLDEEMKASLTNLLENEVGIRNALIYPYSNGKIEAKNTRIKVLKRVSYGFRSFHNMRARIHLNNGLLTFY